MSGQPAYQYLDRVNVPADFRGFTVPELKGLSNDVREFLIEVISRTGGHLGAGLGAVELSVALHYVFNTPNDKLVWDVGHQAYPHKILTGRKDRLQTIRQYKGLSGFLKRSGERVRHLWCRSCQHRDLCGPRHGRSARDHRREVQGCCDRRRRLHDRRHGVRRDEQCRVS